MRHDAPRSVAICYFRPPVVPIEQAMITRTVCDSRLLLILTALKPEYEAVSSAVKHWMHDTPAAARSNAYEEIVVEQIGIRGQSLREILPRYSNSPLAGVIIAGVAGALDPRLGIGDVVIDSASQDAPRIAEFIHAMSGGQNVRIGPIFTSKHMVTSPKEKKLLFEKTRALAVEMENKYTRILANRRAIPWLGIRTISDTAFANMPAQVGRFVDSLGAVRPWEITISLARRPLLIPEVMRLGRHTQIATRKLAEILGAVIRSGWPF